MATGLDELTLEEMVRESAWQLQRLAVKQRPSSQESLTRMLRCRLNMRLMQLPTPLSELLKIAVPATTGLDAELADMLRAIASGIAAREQTDVPPSHTQDLCRRRAEILGKRFVDEKVRAMFLKMSLAARQRWLLSFAERAIGTLPLDRVVDELRRRGLLSVAADGQVTYVEDELAAAVRLRGTVMKVDVAKNQLPCKGVIVIAGRCLSFSCKDVHLEAGQIITCERVDLSTTTPLELSGVQLLGGGEQLQVNIHEISIPFDAALRRFSGELEAAFAISLPHLVQAVKNEVFQELALPVVPAHSIKGGIVRNKSGHGISVTVQLPGSRQLMEDFADRFGAHFKKAMGSSVQILMQPVHAHWLPEDGPAARSWASTLERELESFGFMVAIEIVGQDVVVWRSMSSDTSMYTEVEELVRLMTGSSTTKSSFSLKVGHDPDDGGASSFALGQVVAKFGVRLVPARQDGHFHLDGWPTPYCLGGLKREQKGSARLAKFVEKSVIAKVEAMEKLWSSSFARKYNNLSSLMEDFREPPALIRSRSAAERCEEQEERAEREVDTAYAKRQAHNWEVKHEDKNSPTSKKRQDEQSQRKRLDQRERKHGTADKARKRLHQRDARHPIGGDD